MTPLRPIELAAKALCDVKTARDWLKPEKRAGMKPAVAERVRRAAVELGWRPEVTFHNVEIVITNQNPSRIARAVHDGLADLAKQRLVPKDPA
jgi:hypothetical protein